MHLWHLTSLDAPTVAVVWTLAFAWTQQVRLPMWLVTSLALAAWSVYIGDRLLDARRANTPLRARHHFHWRHRRLFVPAALTAALVAILLVVRSMPFAARERNSVLAAAALAYFTSVHNPWNPSTNGKRTRIPKELLVGVLFTLASAIPTLTRTSGFRLDLLLEILCFVLLAWLNCYAIEFWESSPVAGARTVFLYAMTLAGSTLAAALVETAAHHSRPAAILGAASASALLLAMLDRHRRSLSPTTLRAAADIALLTPVALLVIR